MNSVSAKMKRIVIFGATGRTGLCALNHAVKTGYDTRVFVRDANKIPEDVRDKVEAVVGDVTNAEQVANAVKDRDGIVVILGTRSNLGPTTELSEGMKNIVEAMKANNVELVSLCLSAFLFPEKKAPDVFQHIHAEHERMYEIVKESNLKWVAVLPPHISDEPDPNCIVKDHYVGPCVPKQQLAEFLIECLKNPENYRKSLGIGIKTK